MAKWTRDSWEDIFFEPDTPCDRSKLRKTFLELIHEFFESLFVFFVICLTWTPLVWMMVLGILVRYFRNNPLLNRWSTTPYCGDILKYFFGRHVDLYFPPFTVLPGFAAVISLVLLIIVVALRRSDRHVVRPIRPDVRRLSSRHELDDKPRKDWYVPHWFSALVGTLIITGIVYAILDYVSKSM